MRLASHSLLVIGTTFLLERAVGTWDPATLAKTGRLMLDMVREMVIRADIFET